MKRIFYITVLLFIVTQSVFSSDRDDTPGGLGVPENELSLHEGEDMPMPPGGLGVPENELSLHEVEDMPMPPGGLGVPENELSLHEGEDMPMPPGGLGVPENELSLHEGEDMPMPPGGLGVPENELSLHEGDVAAPAPNLSPGIVETVPHEDTHDHEAMVDEAVALVEQFKNDSNEITAAHQLIEICEAYYHKDCVNTDGKVYRSGRRMPSEDSCHVCHCGHGGVKECKQYVCPALDCDDPVQPNGWCCPVCPPAVCQDDEGNSYRVGQKAPRRHICEKCRCDIKGQITCRPIKCLELACKNTSKPITIPGKCCQTCQPEVCQLPKSSSTQCEGGKNQTRFYYNVDSGRCEQFVYEGCGGNGNVFKNLAKCEKVCGIQETIPKPLGSHCDNNEECTDEHNICHKGVCKCSPWYRLDESTKQCYQDCSSGGNTYTKYSGMDSGCLMHSSESIKPFTKLSECKVRCSEDPECIAITFSPKLWFGNCTLLRCPVASMLILPTESTTEDTYVKNCGAAIPIPLGSHCNNTDECTDEHNICHKGVCKCSPWYKLDKSTNQCYQDCSPGGNTYTKYSEMDSGCLVHSNESITPFSTLHNCKESCSEDPGCIAVTFNPKLQYSNCTLLLCPPLASMLVLPTESTTVNTYVKNCGTEQTKPHGSPCINHDECTDEDNVCWKGSCVCTPGYRLDESTNQCYQDCSPGGNTYSNYSGLASTCPNISDESKFTDDTLDACESSCTKYPWCMSFTFNDKKWSPCTLLRCCPASAIFEPADPPTVNSYVRNLAAGGKLKKRQMSRSLDDDGRHLHARDILMWSTFPPGAQSTATVSSVSTPTGSSITSAWPTTETTITAAPGADE